MTARLKTMRTGAILFALLILATGLALASTEGRWLHVRVESTDHDGESVKVNIPLELVAAILPTLEFDEFRHGKVYLPDSEIEGIDLRQILEALRDAPDADFVTVSGRNESVVVAKENGLLVVRVDGDDEHVRVKIPLDVVDAMLTGNENEIDLVAGLEALAAYGGGDLIRVESDGELVRVWIDSTETGD